jgi:hypothetical protein
VTGLRIEGTDDLQKVADALKEAGDKDLVNRFRKRLRDAGKPIGLRVLNRGADEMPQRGGLSNHIKAVGKVSVNSALQGRVASISVVLRTKGTDLRSINRGELRHPVFGNREVWVGQPVPVGAWTRAFEAERQEATDAALKAIQEALDDVAGKA